MLALQKQYGTHWELIAEVFNATTNRPAPDYRLGWDLYDRWDKLVGPSSHKVLADGTEIPVEPPPFQPPVDRATGKSPQFVNFDGSRKRLRHLTVYDAMRKVQKKREITAAKQASAPYFPLAPPQVKLTFFSIAAGGIPRRINMSMHESHNLPTRRVLTPMEWSDVKVEQDANKLRMRQQQVRCGCPVVLYEHNRLRLGPFVGAPNAAAAPPTASSPTSSTRVPTSRRPARSAFTPPASHAPRLTPVLTAQRRALPSASPRLPSATKSARPERRSSAATPANVAKRDTHCRVREPATADAVAEQLPGPVRERERERERERDPTEPHARAGSALRPASRTAHVPGGASEPACCPCSAGPGGPARVKVRMKRAKRSC